MPQVAFSSSSMLQHSSSTQEVLESQVLQPFCHLQPCCMGQILLQPFQNHSMALSEWNKTVTKVWCHVLVLDTAHDGAVLSLSRGSCSWCQESSSQVNPYFFCNYIFKKYLIFLAVHVEDKAQHGGRILPGWEEHDLVAGESNTMQISDSRPHRNRLTAHFKSQMEAKCSADQSEALSWSWFWLFHLYIGGCLAVCQ